MGVVSKVHFGRGSTLPAHSVAFIEFIKIAHSTCKAVNALSAIRFITTTISFLLQLMIFSMTILRFFSSSLDMQEVGVYGTNVRRRIANEISLISGVSKLDDLFAGLYFYDSTRTYLNLFQGVLCKHVRSSIDR